MISLIILKIHKFLFNTPEGMTTHTCTHSHRELAISAQHSVLLQGPGGRMVPGYRTALHRHVLPCNRQLC